MKISIQRKGFEPIQGGVRTMWVVDITDVDGETHTSIGSTFLAEFQRNLREAFVESMKTKARDPDRWIKDK